MPVAVRTNRSSFQHLAEPGERMAHGGLTERNPLARPQHAALLHDGVEDLEQVQVQGLEGNSHVQDTVAGGSRARCITAIYSS
ncbi:hypothetical protein ACVW0J_006101 [Bradyrhizobium sp. i1.7.7]